MNVGEELKLKRKQMCKQLEELARHQYELQEQIRAVETVIKIYDPRYVPDGSSGTGQSGRRKQNPVRDELSTLMKGASIKLFVLEILRETTSPLTVADCSRMIAHRLGLDDQDPKISHITRSVAAIIGNLAKRRRLRRSGMSSDRKPRWEVNTNSRFTLADQAAKPANEAA